MSLTISAASHKDLGKYQCRLSSLHGSVTLEYLLTYEGKTKVYKKGAMKIYKDKYKNCIKSFVSF